MRLIGHVNDKSQAERLAAWLLTREISTHCEDNNGSWEIWVRDEDRLEEATRELEAFRADPEAPQYRAAVDEASRIVRDKARKLQRARSQQVQMTGDRWNAPIYKVAPLTVSLVVVSAVVFLLTDMGEHPTGAAFRAMAFCAAPLSAAPDSELVADGSQSWDTPLRMFNIRKGEVWRTVTPIFLHFGILHLLFNMFWLVFFGRQIEYRYGSRWMLLLVVLIAIPSNLPSAVVPAEFDGTGVVKLGSWWIMLAGGMSGVLYGLLGYVWMKMLFDSKSGLQVSYTSIAILLIWLVICMAPQFSDWFGFRPGNWAHGTGLLVGLAIGYFPKLLSDLGVRPGDRNSEPR